MKLTRGAMSIEGRYIRTEMHLLRYQAQARYEDSASPVSRWGVSVLVGGR